MKILGIDFTSKKELRETVCKLEVELNNIRDEFPFYLGQTVYDVALKNAQGRYTKTKPSREYSTITEIEVNEKNYFSLVKRLKRNDVFFSYKEADAFLDNVCK